MASQPSSTDWGDFVAVAALAWGAVHGVYLSVRRWLRRQARLRELQAARDELLAVLADSERDSIRPGDQDEDELDITARVARRRERLDSARDRFWIARGRKRSAPSGAPSDDEDSE